MRDRRTPLPPARDPGDHHLRGDALGLRDRAGLRRRRRHSVVEGIPRVGVRIPRDQGPLHVRRRLGGADGPRGGMLDALSRSALPLPRTSGGFARCPERVDLVRRAGDERARRRARDPRRERACGLARPRGRVWERRDRLALTDAPDGQADGTVPAGDRLRHLRLERHAPLRQHVRRWQLRRRRPRRVAHDPARLAGRRRHRTARRAGRRRRPGARGSRRAGRVCGVRVSTDHGPGGDRGDGRAGQPGPPRSRSRGRRRRRRPRARRGDQRPRRRPRARPGRLSRRGGGGARHAATTRLGRLPADVGDHRCGGRRQCGRERPEPVQRPGDGLPPRRRAVATTAGASTRARSAIAGGVGRRRGPDRQRAARCH